MLTLASDQIDDIIARAVVFCSSSLATRLEMNDYIRSLAEENFENSDSGVKLIFKAMKVDFPEALENYKHAH